MFCEHYAPYRPPVAPEVREEPAAPVHVAPKVRVWTVDDSLFERRKRLNEGGGVYNTRELAVRRARCFFCLCSIVFDN